MCECSRDFSAAIGSHAYLDEENQKCLIFYFECVAINAGWKMSSSIAIVEMGKSADEQKFIINFIESYKKLPALWNKKCEKYSNRDEKKKQYKILLEFYKKKYPEATIEDIKKKINVLRTNYQREKLKISKSNRSGAGAFEDVEESSLFYFNQMKFLDEVEKPSTTRSTMNSNNEPAVDKARKRKEDPSKALLEIAAKRFASKERSATRLAAESWAAKLEEMEPLQRMLCEKFISDIIFEGQMGTLTRNSVQISPCNIPVHYFSSIKSHSSSSTPIHFAAQSNEVSPPPPVQQNNDSSH